MLGEYFLGARAHVCPSAFLVLSSMWHITVKGIRSFLREIFRRFSAHNSSRMGAALSYYALFSLSPLLVIVVGIVGIVFGTTEAESAVLSEASVFLGPDGEQLLSAFLREKSAPASGIIAASVGFLLLLAGAGSVFRELKSALNTIFEIPEKKTGFWGFLRANLLTFGMVVATGFLLLISLILTAFLGFLSSRLSSLLPLPEWILEGVNMVASFALSVGVFALVFRYIPDRALSWTPILRGALFTAILFVIGKSALGIYLGRSGVASSYGAAGSVVLILLWMYYTSHIVFLGAEAVGIFSETGRRPNAASR